MKYSAKSADRFSPFEAPASAPLINSSRTPVPVSSRNMAQKQPTYNSMNVDRNSAYTLKPGFGEQAERLKKLLKQIKYPTNIRSRDLAEGKASVYIQILEYFLRVYSKPINDFFIRQVSLV